MTGPDPNALDEAARLNWEGTWAQLDAAAAVAGWPKSTISWNDVNEGLKEEWRRDVHRPHRGSDVERWLKAQRDRYKDNDEYDVPRWLALDEALDQYRLRADTGLLLHEDIEKAGP